MKRRKEEKSEKEDQFHFDYFIKYKIHHFFLPLFLSSPPPPSLYFFRPKWVKEERNKETKGVI